MDNRVRLSIFLCIFAIPSEKDECFQTKWSLRDLFDGDMLITLIILLQSHLILVLN